MRTIFYYVYYDLFLSRAINDRLFNPLNQSNRMFVSCGVTEQCFAREVRLAHHKWFTLPLRFIDQETKQAILKFIMI